MKVSAKIEYACIAVLELAIRHGSAEPVRIRTIADKHGIPSRFLVQILLQLKGAGLVTSTRGASGGYKLQRAPDEIALGEVMDVIEGREGAGLSAVDPSPTARAIWRVWLEAAETQRELFHSITLAELVERAKGEAEAMYYI